MMPFAGADASMVPLVALHHRRTAVGQLGDDLAEPLRADRPPRCPSNAPCRRTAPSTCLYSCSSSGGAPAVHRTGHRTWSSRQFGAARPTLESRRCQRAALTVIHVSIVSPPFNDVRHIAVPSPASCPHIAVRSPASAPRASTGPARAGFRGFGDVSWPWSGVHRVGELLDDVADCGCDATFAGLAPSRLWQVPPQLRRPTGLRGPQTAGTASSTPDPAADSSRSAIAVGAGQQDRVIQDPAGAIDEVAIGPSKRPIWTKHGHSGRPNEPLSCARNQDQGLPGVVGVGEER